MFAIDGSANRREPKLMVMGGWAFIVATIFLGVQLPGSGIKLGNLLMLAGAYFAMACVLISQSQERRFRYALYGSDYVYLVYITWCLISTQWSRSPIDTAVQTVYLASVWLATLHLRDMTLGLALRLLVRSAALICVASFVLAGLLPEVGFQPHSTTGLPELRGIFEHQQRLGLFCGMILGLLVIAWANDDIHRLFGWQRWSVIAVAFVIFLALVAAQARLYTAAFIISVAFTFGLSKPGLLRKLSLVSLAAFVGLAVLNTGYTMQVLDSIGTEGNTLSGRTTVWERSLEVAHTSPMRGHGYASFFSSHFDYVWGNYRAPNAHSSFIQAYFETGIVGLSLTLLLIGVQIREALRVGRLSGKYSYSFFLILLAAASSATGVTYAGKPTILFSVLLLVLAIENRQLGFQRGGKSFHRPPRQLGPV